VRFKRIEAIRGEEQEASARSQNAVQLSKNDRFAWNVLQHLIQKNRVKGAIRERKAADVTFLHAVVAGVRRLPLSHLIGCVFYSPHVGGCARQSGHIFARPAASIQDSRIRKRDVTCDQRQPLSHVARRSGITAGDLDRIVSPNHRAKM
jgi:hypothetical protein